MSEFNMMSDIFICSLTLLGDFLTDNYHYELSDDTTYCPLTKFSYILLGYRTSQLSGSTNHMNLSKKYDLLPLLPRNGLWGL